jgi:DNA modification methylase
MHGSPAEVLPIHPFPARMAPEIALEEVASLRPGSLVLDPMAGSGTVVRVAAERGHRALGFDLDPLAVLMAKVWTTPIDVEDLRAVAQGVVKQLKERTCAEVSLPWIDDDQETREFVDYWFAEAQRADLRRLSAGLRQVSGPIGDVLRIGLSRIIITKDRGASLARDVSHSRPHRVRLDNDFPVIEEFKRSVARLAQRLEEQPPPGNVIVDVGDARHLSAIETSSIDAVITSPPYLNAIDYLRGHRLALVWLGHRVGGLRALRSASIGAECRPDPGADLDLARELAAPLGPLDQLPRSDRRMIDRYVLDLHTTLLELRRVLRPGGKAVLVVGNSCIRGVFIRNARVVVAVAERVGFDLVKETERALPPNRRYLPPPPRESSEYRVQSAESGRTETPYSALGLEKRMRSETVLTFRRPATPGGVR